MMNANNSVPAFPDMPNLPREYVELLDYVPFDVVRQYTEHRVAVARAQLRAYVQERRTPARRRPVTSP